MVVELVWDLKIYPHKSRMMSHALVDLLTMGIRTFLL